MICPICKADRPDEHHLDWCTYEGPEPDEDGYLDDDDERDPDQWGDQE